LLGKSAPLGFQTVEVLSPCSLADFIGSLGFPLVRLPQIPLRHFPPFHLFHLSNDQGVVCVVCVVCVVLVGKLAKSEPSLGDRSLTVFLINLGAKAGPPSGSACVTELGFALAGDVPAAGGQLDHGTTLITSSPPLSLGFFQSGFQPKVLGTIDPGLVRLTSTDAAHACITAWASGAQKS